MIIQKKLTEKTNSITKEDASNNFATYLLDNLNYKIIKCYDVFIDLNFLVLLKNLGFISGAITVLINVICLLVFSFKALDQIRIKIYKSLPKYNESAIHFTKNEPAPRRKNQKKKPKSVENQKSNTSKSKTIIIQNNIILSKKHLKPQLRKGSHDNFLTKQMEIKKNNCEIIDNIDYNNLPYAEALDKDQRNFFLY